MTDRSEKTQESLKCRIWERVNFVLGNADSSEMSVEVVRYLVIGGLNTVLTFLVFTAGLYLFRIHYLLALLMAFLVGSIFTYACNYKWVFRPDLSFKFNHRFFKYVIPNAGTYSANLIAMYVLVDIWRGDPFISALILMPLVVAANFIFSKYWAFRK